MISKEQNDIIEGLIISNIDKKTSQIYKILKEDKILKDISKSELLTSIETTKMIYTTQEDFNNIKRKDEN